MKITKRWLIVFCAMGLLIGTVAAVPLVILATSQTIHITVTPPAYGLTLYLNGSTLTTYSGTINPGDTLNLTAVATPSATTLGKTVTFLVNGQAFLPGTGTGTATITTNNGFSEAQTTWTVPALTSGGIAAGFDVYDISATLS